jgi:hypothetical protein
VARIVTHEPRYRPITGQEDAPTPDFDLKRIGTGVQDDPPPMRPYTAWDVDSQRAHEGPPSNDALIRRDGLPQYLVQNYQRAGAQVNNWTAAGPARPTLWSERGQTLTPRRGVTQSRWFQNPAAPGTGLHTAVNNDASGAIGSAGRYTDADVPQMRARRQNRLSPAVYSGQSFSQTTKLQGSR